MGRQDAQIVAQVLVTTDMRGVRTHGTLQLRGYVRQIMLGGMNPKAELQIVREGPTWAALDASGGSGVVASYKAMKIAMAKAKSQMIGMVSVRNSNHFGAAGYYAGMCLEEKLIGLAMTNGDPTMSTPGAAARVLSNDPLAYAVPAGEENPVALDIAMSMVAGVKVHQAARQGRQVPQGWIIDKYGRPTTNPLDFENGGAHIPIGGHKGFGLALLVEILAGVLSGSGITQEVRSFVVEPDKSSGVGHFFIALDPQAFMPVDEFTGRMDRLVREVKSTPRAEGVNRIYLPGEMEWEQEAAAEVSGLVLEQATLDNFQALAKDLGLEAEAFWNN